MVKYKCKYCGEEIICENEEDFEENTEEELWGHIQLEHEEKFEEVQDLDTPDMINECYETEE